MNPNSDYDQPIVCDLTVFQVGEREQMAATVPVLFQAVQRANELNDGYAFQFPNEPGMWLSLAQFVENERQCCPFYRFVLEIEPGGGPLWLHLTGGDGVKAFMETVWNDLSGAVPKQLMRTGPSHDLDAVIAQAAPVLADVMSKAIPLSAEHP